MARPPRPGPAEPPAPRRRPVALYAAWIVALAAVAGGAAWLWLTPPPPPTFAPPVEVVTPLPPPPAPAPAAEAPPAPPPPAPAPAPAPAPVPPPAPAPPPPPPPPPTPPPPPPPPPPLPRATPAPAPAPPPAAAPRPPPAAEAPPSTTVVAAEQPLPPAPDPALVEQGPFGPLPVVGRDGRQPWQVYARPFSDPQVRPRIGVVIGALGLSEAATNAAITRLPAAITLSFLAYGRDLPASVAAARAGGHEVVLQVPMEAERAGDDAGPQALLSALTPTENLSRLEWSLGRATGYVGIAPYMGTRLLTVEGALRPVLGEVRRRGLLFLDTRPNLRSAGAPLARELSMAVVRNDVWLDVDASRAAIDARLEELERVARANGAAVGFAFSYPVTLDRLVAWAETLEDKGLVLAPVSAIVNRQPAR